MIKKVLKYFMWLLVIIIILVVTYAYLSFTPIMSEETIDSGSYNEFTIGMSKQEAYRAIQELYKANKIESLYTLYSKKEEIDKYPEFRFIGQRQSIEKVKDVFNWYDVWLIYVGSEMSIFEVKFNGSKLSIIIRGVDYQGDMPAGIKPGQSYSQVYSQLVEFFNAHSDKNLTIRSGWSARRQPVEFIDEEYRFVERDNRHTIYMKTYIGYRWLQLYFDEKDDLIKIVKNFQLMNAYP